MALWSTQSALRECQMAANGELTVVERLASLLETGQFADVSIKVGKGKDTQVFKAHRLLLATASQPLNKLISSTYENGSGESPCIVVNDIDPESFQNVLKFIYTDDVKIASVAEALGLMRISKQWSLDTLNVRTLKFVNQFLQEFEPHSEDMKNELCELLLFTENDGDTVNKKCWEVLLKYVNDIVPCQGYLSFTENILRKLLMHKDFKYKNQLVLFEAIRDWGMNQVLMRNLSVNQLQPLISDLLKYVNFGAIKDTEFLDTVLPSECLSKSDMIAFFLARGMDIPRDLAWDPSLDVNSNETDFEKAIRFKRGFKISDQEIYKEHELRFRVDRNLKLFGVVFGFLFSNIDMGITVHCQGPWETRQWTDIIQTYCKVSYERMQSADVRLMFSEPVLIEANHSYKILVRVSRMSAGTSEVELWGGGEGQPSVKTKDSTFYFIKSAIDPKKEVQENDIDNKPSMITELIYQHEDYEPPIRESISDKRSSPPKQSFSKYQPGKKFPDLSIKKVTREDSGDADHKLTRPAIVNIEDEETPLGTSNYKRNRPNKPSTPTVEASKPSSPWQSKIIPSRVLTSKTEENQAPITKSKTTGQNVPDYLSTKEKKSLEASKLPWMIPSKSKTDNLGFLSRSTRETSVTRNREPSVSRTIRDYKPISRTSSSTKFDSGMPSRYVGNFSQSPSYLRINSTGLSTSSRSGQVTPAAAYGKDTGLSMSPANSSILSKSVSSFLNKTSKYRQPSPARFGTTSSGTSSSLGEHKPSSYSSTSRYGQPSTSYGTSSSSLSNKDIGASSRLGDSKYTVTSKDSSGPSRDALDEKPSSKHGESATTSTDTKNTSKYSQPAKESSFITSRFGGAVSSIASKLGQNTTKYNNPSSSSLGDKDSSTSLSSRYGPSSSISSTSRYGTDSPSFSSRFGSSRFSSGLSSIYSPSSSRYTSSYRR